MVPLVIATGAGAEMRQALGTAVFFGMLGVTLFGLFFTPVFYVVTRRLALLRAPGGGAWAGGAGRSGLIVRRPGVRRPHLRYAASRTRRATQPRDCG